MKPAPDLMTALQQVLRQVREETKHEPWCNVELYPDIVTIEHSALVAGGAFCSCHREERVEAEQARRMKSALFSCFNNTWTSADEWPDKMPTPEQEQAIYDAAVGAAQQE